MRIFFKPFARWYFIIYRIMLFRLSGRIAAQSGRMSGRNLPNLCWIFPNLCCFFSESLLVFSESLLDFFRISAQSNRISSCIFPNHFSESFFRILPKHGQFHFSTLFWFCQKTAHASYGCPSSAYFACLFQSLQKRINHSLLLGQNSIGTEQTEQTKRLFRMFVLNHDYCHWLLSDYAESAFSICFG